MKRGIIFLFFAFVISIILSSCGSSLSEEELQKRADDYSLLLETLQAVGYDNDFKLLKEKNSMEQNLRNLWTYYFSDHDFTARDIRKNTELLILLGNFDFIAEGLKSKASSNNPYYNVWPRDSQYNTKSKAVLFSDEEVLWLMLLLPDSDIPEEHLGLKEVLAECGENVLGQDLFDPGTSEGIWFYYEKICPGLLEKIDPDFPDYFSNEIKTAFKNADDDLQNRFMQAIDPKNFRSIYYSKSPARVFSFDEAEELMKEFPPTGSWDGGYIRVVDDPTYREGIDKYGISDYNINTSVYGAYTYARESDALVPVINPTDARFAVYEEYTDGEYYATYTGSRDFDVYLLNLNIRIVNLLTGEEIFSELAQSNPPPDEISWSTYNGIGELRIVDGKYYYNDFDWSRYAAVMEGNGETSVSSIRQER
ncbi:hypothetical protein [Lacrimispora sp.]|uniref:hypothetical protein n=1 Tax=Lacrimispora sp. TaxID=2719234 RepID=UPI00345FB8DA